MNWNYAIFKCDMKLKSMNGEVEGGCLHMNTYSYKHTNPW